MGVASITQQEFAHFQRFIYDAAGITLSSSKQALVGGRLARRLEHCGFSTYAEYFRLLASGEAPDEVQIAVDLLTTNETYFFREAKHFELLRQLASEPRRRPEAYRVWSAAGSTGEEAYSIAMVLADCRDGLDWDVIASDVSTRVLERARRGHYPLTRTQYIPKTYLKRFCWRGTGHQEGTLLVDRSLRSRVQFLHMNLNAPLPSIGTFDVIFLRNVMIYFNHDTKRQVVARVLSRLRPGGHLLIGHSETLNGISEAVQPMGPAIYRLPVRP